MIDRFRGLALTATLLMAAASHVGMGSAARGQDRRPVSVIAFPGAGNWLIRIAQEKGYFAQNGIEVSLTPTPNSVFQMTSLIEGRFDIAMTAIDNVIAYLEGQGEVAVAAQPDLFVFMGGSPAIPALVTIPEVKAYHDRRPTLDDAVKTGYAFVLYDLLRRNGLQPGDYKVESAGGTAARWQGLREHKYAAAILTRPSIFLRRLMGSTSCNMRGTPTGTTRRRLLQPGVAGPRLTRTSSWPTSRRTSSRSNGSAISATRTRLLAFCARSFLNSRLIWRRQPTRMSSVRGASPPGRNSISRASARCWSCAANMASRRSCSPIPPATTTCDTTRLRSTSTGLARCRPAHNVGPGTWLALHGDVPVDRHAHIGCESVCDSHHRTQAIPARASLPNRSDRRPGPAHVTDT